MTYVRNNKTVSALFATLIGASLAFAAPAAAEGISPQVISAVSYSDTDAVVIQAKSKHYGRSGHHRASRHSGFSRHYGHSSNRRSARRYNQLHYLLTDQRHRRGGYVSKTRRYKNGPFITSRFKQHRSY